VGGQAEKHSEDADLEHHYNDGFVRCPGDVWFGVSAVGVELHDASCVGDGLDTGQSENDADKAFPVVEKTAVQRLDAMDCGAEVWQTEESQENDHNNGRDGNQGGETAGMFGPEEVERANDDNSEPCENFRARHAQVLECGQSANSSGHQVIGDKEKCAYDRNDFRAVPDAGVDTAAVRIMAADYHVVNAHERGKQGHGGNEPKRRVARDGESEPDDVGFAGAPVAVEDGSGARPIDVAWTFGVADDHGGKSEGSVRA